MSDLPKRSLAFDAAAAALIVTLAFFGASGRARHEEANAFSGLRAFLTDRINSALDPPLSAWASGILLGADDGFSARWKEVFRRTGTTHLTAVSGYNVSIVLMGAYFALRRAPVSRGARTLLGLSAVAFFILLTGHPASVVRAGLMAGFVELARHFGRPVKPLRALLLAVLAASLIEPGLLARDLGFQLSVAATFGLAALAPPLRATVFRGWPGETGEWASQAVAASVMTAPLVAKLNGGYSLVAFVANVALAACLPVLMLVAGCVAAAAALHAAFGSLLGALAAPFLALPLQVLRLLSSAPAASLGGASAWLILIAAQAAILLLIARWHRREGRRYLLSHVQDV